MANGQEQVVLHSVQTLFSVGTAGGMSDGELLERFVGRRDAAEAAFRVLVARHGPAVLGICRRVLKDPHDAEDAFQATFLVLVRNGSSILNRDSLGPWLCEVARRVAVRAKANDFRRRDHERPGGEDPPDPEIPDGRRHDRIEAIHDEVDRLPLKYRVPVVLCYLEGLTYEEAALRLHLTVGTIRGRLARARDLLRARLSRQGEGAALPLGAMLGRPTALPPDLAHSTARAVLRFISGDLSAMRPVSLTLAKGVLQTMFLRRLMIAVGASLAIAATGIGPVLSAQQDVPSERVSPPKQGRESAASGIATVRNDQAEPEASRAVGIDPDLDRLIPGRIVRYSLATKDCMVLSYLPDWSHGNVDNIAVANNDGGVRTLVNWRELNPDIMSSNVRIYLAFYSRKTRSDGPLGSILAFPLLGDWPERTSWNTMPEYDAEPSGTYKFMPGDGWKVFDITPVVRGRAQAGRPSHGVMLRFLREDRSGAKKNWSGYEFVSREGTGRWEDRRPRILIVKPAED